MITEPGPFDTEVEQGATYEKTFYVEVANAPFNFSGYTFAGAIKLRPEDEDQILTLTNSNFTAGALGYVTVYISKDVTATLPVKKLSWSMRCIQPDTKEFPLLAGVFEVKVRRVNG